MRYTVWHCRTDGCGRSSMYQTETMQEAKDKLPQELSDCTDHLWLYPFTVVVTKGARQKDVVTLYEHVTGDKRPSWMSLSL